MTSTSATINRFKIYSVVFLIFLLVNFAFETFITWLENETQQWLYPIFPFTRIGLLIITILITNSYVRRRLGKPKHKLWWRILKPILFILVAYGLTMGAWLTVSEADADRARAEREKVMQELPVLERPVIKPVDGAP